MRFNASNPAQVLAATVFRAALTKLATSRQGTARSLSAGLGVRRESFNFKCKHSQPFNNYLLTKNFATSYNNKILSPSVSVINRHTQAAIGVCNPLKSATCIAIKHVTVVTAYDTKYTRHLF